VSEGDALDLELAIDRVFYELKDAGFPVVSVHLAAAATLSEQFQTIEDHLTCLIVYRAAAS
jgi:uncharacterized protein (DUF302 family)